MFRTTLQQPLMLKIMWATLLSTPLLRYNSSSDLKSVDFKGTVRPDWICMRVAALDRP